MDLILYVHEWTTGKFDLLKYQQYMLTMCECWGGGGGGGECHIMCFASPQDVASYSKLLIQRQCLIQRQGHPKVYHRQACRKQLKSGQASREQGEGWRERGNQSCSSSEANLHISCNLRGINH